MSNLMNEPSSRTNGATHEIKPKVPRVENQLAKISHEAGEKLGEMSTSFANKTSDYVKLSHTYVKENPVKSVAIAATAGAVVGGLLAAALRRTHNK